MPASFTPIAAAAVYAESVPDIGMRRVSSSAQYANHWDLENFSYCLVHSQSRDHQIQLTKEDMKIL